MKKSIVIPMIALLAILAVTVGFAGVTYLIVCKNDKCKFESEVSFGGGFVFEQLTGYCVGCKKFVYLRWTREGKQINNSKAKPEPIARIWNPSTGEIRELYACSDCKKLFLPLISEKELTHCPKCGQVTLKKDMREHFD